MDNARQQQPQMRMRIPLFAKIIGAFVVIVLFMISSSLYLLGQLRGALDTQGSELRKINERILLAQDLDSNFVHEMEALRAYSGAGNPADMQEYISASSTFRLMADSLRNIADRDDLRARVELVCNQHAQFADSASHILKSRTGIPPLIASMSVTIPPLLGKVQDLLRASFNRKLRLFESQTENNTQGAFFILVLSFVIGLCIAFLLAHNVSRPIKALKAGTQKVAEGKYETVQVTSTDEIAELTHAFNTMSEKLRQLDEMRMEMMSEISHEMRTPLQVIKAACYSIAHQREGAMLNQKQSDALGMIHQATNRITSFVNAFLDVAKLEAGLMKFHFEPVELVGILTPIVSEAQLIGQARQVNVECEFDSIPPLPFDKDRMSMVFTNLLSNALKYTPEQGKIMVRAKYKPLRNGAPDPTAGKVVIEVQDTGVGIPPQDLEKLFNKFYQANNTPLVKEKGSGLGLALVKHIVEAHGGKVSVESQLGAGSKFTIILPASAPVIAHHHEMALAS